MTDRRAVSKELGHAAPDDEQRLGRLARLVESAGARLQVVSQAGDAVELPMSLVELLREAMPHLARGESLALVPLERRLTTQQAADMLNVSRPYLVRLLDAGEISYERTGTHRRVRAADVLAYKAARDQRRRGALRDLTHLSQELGLYGQRHGRAE